MKTANAQQPAWTPEKPSHGMKMVSSLFIRDGWELLALLRGFEGLLARSVFSLNVLHQLFDALDQPINHGQVGFRVEKDGLPGR
jgi:hypothetical protein